MKYIVIWFVFFCLGFPGRTQNITITGYVYNQETARPLALVNVSTVGNNHLKDDQTDSEGLFVLSLKSGIKAGDLIRIRASKDGFDIRDERIVVSSLKPITIQLSRTLKTTVTPDTKTPASPTALSDYRKKLRNEVPSVRQEACKSLGHMGEKAKAAVPDLVSILLYDAVPAVKVSAIEALSAINTSSKEAVEGFVTATKNQDPLVRQAAAKALGGISPAPHNATKALISALKDKEPRVQVNAMASLLVLNQNLYSHVLPVLPFALVNREEAVRTAAYNALLRIDALPPEMLSVLIRVFYNELPLTGTAQSQEEDDNVRYQVMDRTIQVLSAFEKKGQPVTAALLGSYKPEKAIEKYFPGLWLKADSSDKGMTFLVSMLTNQYADTVVKTQLVKQGPTMIPVLQKELALNPLDKIWLADLLMRLDSTLKPQLTPYILEATKGADVYAWKEVTQLLKHDDFNALNERQVLLKAVLMDKAILKNDDFYWQVQRGALNELLPGLLKDPGAVPLLADLIQQSSPNMYSQALTKILDFHPVPNAVLEALWKRRMKDGFDYEGNLYMPDKTIGLVIRQLNTNPAFLPEMVSWFNKFSPGNQAGMIAYFQDYGADAKHTVPVLINALEKGDELQYAAVACLEKIGPAAAPAVPALKKAKKATSDARLKLKIETTLRVIGDK